jgi:hypothetical protein
VREGAAVPIQVIPRELVFYDLLEDAARNVVQATAQLVAMVDEVPSVTLRAEEIRDLEHRGDDLTHQIISTLNQTFVVPLDRHDILRLASALDDIVDFQEGVAELMELLPIKEVFPDARAEPCCVRSPTFGTSTRCRRTSRPSSARSARVTSCTGVRSRSSTERTTGRSRC